MLRDRLPVLLAACIAALCLATFIRFDASSPEQPEAAAHPAPPPTTGTNLLAKLLRANCVLPRECAGVATRGAPGHSDASAVEAEIALFAAFHGTRKGDRLLAGCAPFLPQVPWGKHNPYSHAGRHRAPSYERVNSSEVLPVVVAKDPLAWVGSVCREPYALRFASGACAAVGDVAAPWPAGPRTYASLFDLWAAWHGEYLDAATLLLGATRTSSGAARRPSRRSAPASAAT
ncbi:hypothetical protein JL720_13621 [Aureococcus anophagefferens]|nr:hypothetical protein JL720_13621 [Aureococcus anophagefferens]